MTSSQQLRISYVKSEATPIPRAATLQEFRQLMLQKNEPVAYKIPESEQFPAFQKWTKEYFAAAGGNRKVVAHRCYSEDRFLDLRNASLLELARNVFRHRVTLSDHVARTMNNAAAASNNFREFLSGVELHMRRGYQDRPEFQDWIDDTPHENFLPGSCTKKNIRTTGLWVSANCEGGPIMSSQMHYDRNELHNLNFQIRGQKLFTLYHPTDGTQNLYYLPNRFRNLSLAGSVRARR